MRNLSRVLASSALAFVTACGFDPEGGGVDASDARVDAMADTDGDGRPDSADNCVMVANADQADEDTDGLGDVCDKCPHIGDATQPDGDGDGVGDACDPRPAMQDHIAAFYGFNGTTLPSELGPVGLWSVGGGMLRQPSAEVGNRILAVNGKTLTDAVVDTSFDIVLISPDVPATSPERSVGALLRYQDGTIHGTGYLCEVAQNALDLDNAGQLSTRFQNDGSVSGGDLDGLPLRLATGRNVRMISSSTGDAQTCQTATTATVSSTFQDSMSTTGTVALRTHGVAANFRYLVVIAPGPP